MICNHVCIDCWSNDSETCAEYDDSARVPRTLTPEELKELENDLPF